MSILAILHLALCAGIAWTVFERAVQTSTAVRRDVRAAFNALGAVAVFAVAAPFVWSWSPDLGHVALEGSILAVQLVTGYHWRHGVPEPFYRPGVVPPRRRRSTDTQKETPCP